MSQGSIAGPLHFHRIMPTVVLLNRSGRVGLQACRKQHSVLPWVLSDFLDDIEMYTLNYLRSRVQMKQVKSAFSWVCPSREVVRKDNGSSFKLLALLTDPQVLLFFPPRFVWGSCFWFCIPPPPPPPALLPTTCPPPDLSSQNLLTHNSTHTTCHHTTCSHTTRHTTYSHTTRHTTYSHTTCSHTTQLTQLNSHNLLTTQLTQLVITQLVITQLVITQLAHTLNSHNLSSHNLLTHSTHTTCHHTTCSHTTQHSTYSHTTCLHTQLTQLVITQLAHTQLNTPLTHTQLAHTQLNSHNLSSHNLLTHNSTCSHITCHHTTARRGARWHNLLTHNSTHHLLTHNLLTHNSTHTTCHHTSCHHVAGVALTALGGLWWRTEFSAHAVGAAALCVAGVALGDIHLRFTWQAWHLITSTFVSRGRRGTYGTGRALVAHQGPSWRRGRRGSLRGRHGTWWHPPCTWSHPHSFHVAGVALAALGGLWWRTGVPADAVDAAALCMAGMALGDIHLHFAWQAWH